ncbi:MAG: MerR family transcriptional regulator [Desulfovibrio sp.]|nr:MerR family transcriptional regulator [Desulfovibrio sp.]
MAEAKCYRIGEVAEMLSLKTHVLRFWETEFSQLMPLRTESGQRLYTEAHIDILRRIQRLLHEQGMTIEGAKRVLAGEAEEAQPDAQEWASPEFLAMLRMELGEIRAILAGEES